MNASWRTIFVIGGAIGLGAFYLAACACIPNAAERPSRYAAIVNRDAFAARQVTGIVSAVNFDFRGFDTLGEEFILFVSVMGVVVLLREAEDKQQCAEDADTPRRAVKPSEAVRLGTLAATGPVIIFGLYLATHGHLTPGGGFQAGVVLATAPLLIYLADGLEAFRTVVSLRLVEACEAVGAGGFVAVGLLGSFSRRAFLANVLPPGERNELASGGTITVINGVVALAVAAGFLTLLHAFLQSALSSNRSRP